MFAKIETNDLRTDSDRALELVEAGDVRGGCACLMGGLLRARRMQRAGFGGAAPVVARYEGAIALYVARYRPVQPRRPRIAGFHQPASGRWAN